jgi:hypothetical protein
MPTHSWTCWKHIASSCSRCAAQLSDSLGVAAVANALGIQLSIQRTQIAAAATSSAGGGGHHGEMQP